MKLTTILKYLPWVALAVLAIILFRSCHSARSHKDDTKEIQVVAKDYARYKDSAETASAKIKQTIVAQDLLITALYAERDAGKVQLSLRGQTIARLTGALETAKKGKDTTTYYASCDSLADQVQFARKQLEYQSSITEDIDKAHRDQESSMQVQIDIKTAQNKVCEVALDTALSKYAGLYKDYTKVRRRSKSNGFFSRVTAGIAAFAITLLLLKK